MEEVTAQLVQAPVATRHLSKSMNKIIPAGGISKRAVEMNQQEREALMRIRTYKADDDQNRELANRDALTRVVSKYLTLMRF